MQALRVLVIVSALVIWVTPLTIAVLYHLPRQGPIAVLSLLLGWTGAAWLAAFAIAIGGAIRATRPVAEPGPQLAPDPGMRPAGVPLPTNQPDGRGQGFRSPTAGV